MHAHQPLEENTMVLSARIVHNIENLAAGDHLVSSRIFYAHHGIYLGEGKVIHYAGWANGLRAGKIEITSLADFMQDKLTRVIPHTNKKFSAKQIVARAKSRLDEDSYCVIRNNCEHFVNWCIHDKPHSRQVKSAVSLAGVALMTILA